MWVGLSGRDGVLAGTFPGFRSKRVTIIDSRKQIDYEMISGMYVHQRS